VVVDAILSLAWHPSHPNSQVSESEPSLFPTTFTSARNRFAEYKVRIGPDSMPRRLSKQAYAAV